MPAVMSSARRALSNHSTIVTVFSAATSVGIAPAPSVSRDAGCLAAEAAAGESACAKEAARGGTANAAGSNPLFVKISSVFALAMTCTHSAFAMKPVLFGSSLSNTARQSGMEMPNDSCSIPDETIEEEVPMAFRPGELEVLSLPNSPDTSLSHVDVVTAVWWGELRV